MGNANYITSYDEGIEILKRVEDAPVIISNKDIISAYDLIDLMTTTFSDFYTAFYDPDFKQKMLDTWISTCTCSSYPGKVGQWVSVSPKYDGINQNYHLRFHFGSFDYHLDIFQDRSRPNAYYCDFSNYGDPQKNFESFEVQRNQQFSNLMEQDILKLFFEVREYEQYLRFLDPWGTRSTVRVPIAIENFSGFINFYHDKINHSLSFENIHSGLLNGVWSDGTPSLIDLFNAQKSNILRKIPLPTCGLESPFSLACEDKFKNISPSEGGKSHSLKP